MIRIILWFNLSWKNNVDAFSLLMKKIALLRIRAACLMLRFIPYQTALAVLRMLRYGFPINRQDVLLHKIANENKRCLLGEGSGKLDYLWLNQRRRVLELAATWGRNPQLLNQLARCTQQLNDIVEPLHHSGSPVVLAPLHMVSDILAGITASGVFPGQATVIVSSSAQQFPPGAGIPLTYCSIHDGQQNIASQLTASLSEAAEHKRNIMLFPDITPDFTHQANISGSAKSKCTLFGRSANLHSGIIRISKILSAKIVFFYLYYDEGIKISISPPVEPWDVKVKMAEIIEQAIRRHPNEWLLWHTHSLFFFNE